MENPTESSTEMASFGLRKRLVIVGHGMVGHHLLASCVDRGLTSTWDITIIGEEPRPAYDRVHLSSLFDGATPDDLSLVQDHHVSDPAVTVRTGVQATAVDRNTRIVTLSDGTLCAYDHLVLALGSTPFVPPIPGIVGEGSFVYRTIEDLQETQAYAAGCRTGVVMGGGLLGLEAANALRLLGVKTLVIEMAPRLMAVQIDEGGAKALRRHVEELGLEVHTGFATSAIERHADGRVSAVSAADGTRIEADLLVVAAGIRPRDDLARSMGLTVGERGGVAIDDLCRTSDPQVSAIGECAVHAGRIYGLVAPGYAMAKVVAAHLDAEIVGNSEMPNPPLAGLSLADSSVRDSSVADSSLADAWSLETSFVDSTLDALSSSTALPTFTGADNSTVLKLLGVDVACVGDAHATGDDTREVVVADPIAGTYQKVILQHSKVVGAVLVGRKDAYSMLVQMARGVIPTPTDLLSMLTPSASGVPALGVGALPDVATICSCHNVTKGAISEAIREGDLSDMSQIKSCTKAGTGCGSCVAMVKDLLTAELKAAGKVVNNNLCEHFALSRAQMFTIVHATGITTFAQLIAEHGRGRGCEICKPTAASIFATIHNNYVLAGEEASLQDSNDHFLANIQRNGTYSVIPRVPGGEILPDQLIALGTVAKKYALYTKITGGQRVDLLGARIEQLPSIWSELIDAGFESGHAYGKALRTVKSCVGSTWCRYGVQDSVAMAIALELRYRGLRAPHKFKLAVSGCARECAEAQSKDVGVIATENGWNLYVGGNGGMRPRHAVLFATDLTDEMLVKLIDRYLMLYVRTADRLERTANWQEKFEGGFEELQRIIIEDSLGIAADLEAQMERHVATYACEWKTTIESPEHAARFVTFVNAPTQSDPDITFDSERSQPRPNHIAPILPATAEPTWIPTASTVGPASSAQLMVLSSGQLAGPGVPVSIGARP
jgi:nitrite reductase (NADH) large subunit